MAHGVDTVLKPVCGPVEIPLVFFLPCRRQIPDVLRPAPVTHAGEVVFPGYAGRFGAGERRGGIRRESMPVAVFPLDVVHHATPVSAGDLRFRIRPAVRPGSWFIDEIRRHSWAQPESW